MQYPLGHSVLYLRFSNLEASPKAISGRTSYLQARLEFHGYPQVIPALFNVRGFGPPRNFTFASTCSWIGRPAVSYTHLDTVSKYLEPKYLDKDSTFKGFVFHLE